MRFFKNIVLLLLLLGSSVFAKSVATVTGANGEAHIERNANKIAISLGDALEEKDTILTSSNSKVQLIFRDETVVTIGKNSKFVIEEYLYEDKVPTVKFGMFKGAMRTITGKIGKIAPENFIVQTKTSTIGIRGTNFVISEADNGAQNVFCRYGAISVKVNNQTLIVNKGFFVAISPLGAMEVKKFTAKQLDNMQKSSFGSNAENESSGTPTEDMTSESVAEQLDTTQDYTSDFTETSEVASEVQDATQLIEEVEVIVEPIVQLEEWSGLFTFDNIVVSNEDLIDLMLEGNTIKGGGQSFMQVSARNGANENDKFTLYLNSSSNGVSSFQSVEVNKDQAATSTHNVRVDSGHFRALTDLTPSDHMNWGEWNTVVTYDDSVQTDQTHTLNGLWVTGVKTAQSIIDAREGSANYVGRYRGMDYNDNNAISLGTANLSVDFNNDTASLNLIGEGALNMSLLGNNQGLMGGTNGPMSAYGTFYGPSGNSVGGTFTNTASGKDMQGVYQVTHTPIVSSPHP